jgi:hypothetical protein
MAALGIVVGMAVIPHGIGLPTGMDSEIVPAALAGDFDSKGCLACHGDSAAGITKQITADQIRFSIKDADGKYITGRYTKDAVYTIDIQYTDTNAPTETNRAGFNLRASAGKLGAVEGISQVTSDGAQATHVAPTRDAWSVQWTAPSDDVVVVFNLYINDVNGDGTPDKGDEVHQAEFGLSNSAGAVPGAVVEETVEYGISLQQYWIGIAGLTGMVVIMVGGYFFLKYGNPHNTDAKDR